MLEKKYYVLNSIKTIINHEVKNEEQKYFNYIIYNYYNFIHNRYVFDNVVECKLRKWA